MGKVRWTNVSDAPTAAEVVAHLLAHEVAAIGINAPLARAGEDPEGVHQLRVSARRLRSELGIVAPAMKRVPRVELRRELRWIGDVLGAQRDLDVQSELLRGLSAGLRVPLPGSLLRTIDDERTAESRLVARTLASSRFNDLVARLEAAAADPPLRSLADEPAALVLQPGLDEALAALFHAVARAEDPDPDELHRIRILAKRARYGAEVAGSYLGEAATRVAQQLALAQDVLGRLHDRVVASGFLSRPGDTDSSEPFAPALGVLAGEIAELGTQWRAPVDEAARLAREWDL